MRSPEFNDLVQDAFAVATATIMGGGISPSIVGSKIGCIERGVATDSLWQVSVTVKGGAVSAAAFCRGLLQELSAASATATSATATQGVGNIGGASPYVAQVLCTRLGQPSPTQKYGTTNTKSWTQTEETRGRGCVSQDLKSILTRTEARPTDDIASAREMRLPGKGDSEGVEEVWVVDCVPASGSPVKAVWFAVEYLLGIPCSKARVLTGSLNAAG